MATVTRHTHTPGMQEHRSVRFDMMGGEERGGFFFLLLVSDVMLLYAAGLGVKTEWRTA